MDNHEIVERIKHLPVDEQFKAYEAINPEAFLLKKSIEEKKQQIMEGKYYEKG